MLLEYPELNNTPVEKPVPDIVRLAQAIHRAVNEQFDISVCVEHNESHNGIEHSHPERILVIEADALVSENYMNVVLYAWLVDNYFPSRISIHRLCEPKGRHDVSDHYVIVAQP